MFLKDKLLKSSFDTLNLSKRIITALNLNGINTIKDIYNYNSYDILNIRCIGIGSFNELINTLHNYKIFFKDELKEPLDLVKEIDLLKSKKQLLLDKIKDIDEEIEKLERVK